MADVAFVASPFGGVGTQFFDDSGNLLSGGRIFVYQGGTSTPKAAYTSREGTQALPNPIVLNAAGRVPTGQIWLSVDEPYKFVLQDALGNLIATYDDVSATRGPIGDQGEQGDEGPRGKTGDPGTGVSYFVWTADGLETHISANQWTAFPFSNVTGLPDWIGMNGDGYPVVANQYGLAVEFGATSDGTSLKTRIRKIDASSGSVSTEPFLPTSAGREASEAVSGFFTHGAGDGYRFEVWADTACTVDSASFGISRLTADGGTPTPTPSGGDPFTGFALGYQDGAVHVNQNTWTKIPMTVQPYGSAFTTRLSRAPDNIGLLFNQGNRAGETMEIEASFGVSVDDRDIQFRIRNGPSALNTIYGVGVPGMPNKRGSVGKEMSLGSGALQAASFNTNVAAPGSPFAIYFEVLSPNAAIDVSYASFVARAFQFDFNN